MLAAKPCFANRPKERSKTALTPLVGGAVSDWSSYEQESIARWGEAIGSEAVCRLIRQYGTRVDELMELVLNDGSLREPLCS